MSLANVKLANGVLMPIIGFGTFKAAENGSEIIKNAINEGYRHLDTAAFYDNEEEVAEAIKNSGVKREDLFITSKVWKTELGYDKTMRSFEESLRRLQTDYLDLFLIHWPRNNFDINDESWKELDKQSWKAMEDLYAQGRVKSIGVSNFLPHHLMNIMEEAEIMPMVDQLEIHPGYIQYPAIQYCKEHNIIVEAWSPIGRGRVLKEPLLIELAKKYNKNVGQICLKFVLQLGVVPLPKSSSAERMRGNLDLFNFEITTEDMYCLMTLPQVGWSGEHPDFKV